LRDQLQLSD